MLQFDKKCKLRAVVNVANNHLWQDADCVENIKNFTENIIICQNKLKMSDKIFWKFQFCEN